MNASGLPESTLLSMAVGDLHQQIVYKPGACFSFDVKAAPTDFTLCVFKKSGSKQVSFGDLIAGKTSYNSMQGSIEVPCDDRAAATINAKVTFKDEKTLESYEAIAQQPIMKSKKQFAAAATGYLEKHSVSKVLQTMVRTMLEQQPEDPMTFMTRYLRDQCFGKGGAQVKGSKAMLPTVTREAQVHHEDDEQGEEDSKRVITKTDSSKQLSEDIVAIRIQVRDALTRSCNDGTLGDLLRVAIGLPDQAIPPITIQAEQVPSLSSWQDAARVKPGYTLQESRRPLSANERGTRGKVPCRASQRRHTDTSMEKNLRSQVPNKNVLSQVIPLVTTAVRKEPDDVAQRAFACGKIDELLTDVVNEAASRQAISEQPCIMRSDEEVRNKAGKLLVQASKDGRLRGVLESTCRPLRPWVVNEGIREKAGKMMLAAGRNGSLSALLEATCKPQPVMSSSDLLRLKARDKLLEAHNDGRLAAALDRVPCPDRVSNAIQCPAEQEALRVKALETLLNACVDGRLDAAFRDIHGL